MINILTKIRTEEEKARRRIYGDIGVKFQAKELRASNNPYSNTITTIIKDNLILISYD